MPVSYLSVKIYKSYLNGVEFDVIIKIQ